MAPIRMYQFVFSRSFRNPPTHAPDEMGGSVNTSEHCAGLVASHTFALLSSGDVHDWLNTRSVPILPHFAFHFLVQVRGGNVNGHINGYTERQVAVVTRMSLHRYNRKPIAFCETDGLNGSLLIAIPLFTFVCRIYAYLYLYIYILAHSPFSLCHLFLVRAGCGVAEYRASNCRGILVHRSPVRIRQRGFGCFARTGYNAGHRRTGEASVMRHLCYIAGRLSCWRARLRFSIEAFFSVESVVSAVQGCCFSGGGVCSCGLK